MSDLRSTRAPGGHSENVRGLLTPGRRGARWRLLPSQLPALGGHRPGHELFYAVLLRGRLQYRAAAEGIAVLSDPAVVNVLMAGQGDSGPIDVS